MTDTFTWRGTGQPSGPATFNVLVAKYGDGYSQEAQNGINNEAQSWSMQFVGSKTDIKAIRDFFRAHAGARGFNWTTPLDELGLYKVAAYTPAYQAFDLWVITATFEQKFAP